MNQQQQQTVQGHRTEDSRCIMGSIQLYWSQEKSLYPKKAAKTTTVKAISPDLKSLVSYPCVMGKRDASLRVSMQVSLCQHS